MPFPPNGTLTTDKRTIDDAQTWSTQTDWEAFQSSTNINIDTGTVKLADIPIPASAIAQYDAQKISATDGDPVTTWNDNTTSGFDATGGSPTYRASAINGYPALEFDGVGDNFTASWTAITQPNVIYAVVNLGTAEYVFDSADSGNRNAVYYSTSTGWNLFSSSSVAGSTNTGTQLITAVFDGASSVIREDGTQTGSGDPGSGGMAGITIGSRVGNSQYWDGDIGFIEVHDGMPSNGLQTREQEIADMWGITL